MSRATLTFVVTLVTASAIAAVAVWHGGSDFARFETYMREHSVLGALACVGGFVVSTVLPISALPLLPLAARSYGIPTTILLTTSGWWIGCMIAFFIARFARGGLERVTSLQAVQRLETKLPARVDFGGIVVLRIVFPGDLVGFALGLLRHVRWRTYAVASLIGTVPGAIVLSYAAGELGSGNVVSSALVLAAMALTALLLRRLWPHTAAEPASRKRL